MNVVIYVMDSLRPDRLGCYGYPRATSPNLDQLAREGIRFQQAFAQATWTRPSAGSLWTGCYPSVHGARNMDCALSSGLPTLAQRLCDAGYSTAAFVSIGQLSRQAGFAEGFDHYDELWRRTGRHDGVEAATRNVDLVSDASVVSAAQRWIERLPPDTPFLALLWTIGTHVPYQLTPVGGRSFVQDEDACRRLSTLAGLWSMGDEHAFRCLNDMYDEAIFNSDQALGSLVSYLKQQGLYEDTVFVILGDHGELFNEHSRGEHFLGARSLERIARLPFLGPVFRRYRLTNQWGMTGHLDVLPYDEVLHVPLIMRVPGLNTAPCEPTRLVQLVDVAPTVLEVVGLSALAEGMQGTSMLPLLEDHGPVSPVAFSDSQRHGGALRFVSMRDQVWKLVRIFRPAGKHGGRHRSVMEQAYRAIELRLSPKYVLYRIGQEGADCASSEVEVRERMANDLQRWEDDNQALATRFAGQAYREDSEVSARLRALGYLD